MKIMKFFRPKSVQKALDSNDVNNAGMQTLSSDALANHLAKDVLNNQAIQPNNVNPNIDNNADVNVSSTEQAKSTSMQQTLEICRDLCSKLLTETGDKLALVQKKWQDFYASLNDEQKKAVWNYSEQQLPHIKEEHDKSFINKLWVRIFNNESIIRRMLKGNFATQSKQHGLVYCYLISGKIRYIGQTKQSSFFKRLLNMQIDNSDYKAIIKRNLLNAYRLSNLEIQVQAVDLKYIDQYQQALIKKYAPTNKLWNEEGNDYFSADNYNFSF